MNLNHLAIIMDGNRRWAVSNNLPIYQGHQKGAEVLWEIINDIDDYYFDGNFIESQAFAFLAIRSHLNLPISFPSTTRCKLAVSGGDIQKNF